MKKVGIAACVALLILALCPATTTAKSNREPGGLPAFFIGCCWGLREGVEWNEGADMHWREWFRMAPVVGFAIAIWDGYDCYNGIGAKDWAEANGANWY